MNLSGTPARVGGFGLALAVVFALALGLGRWVGPLDPASSTVEHDGATGHAVPAEDADDADDADAPRDEAGAGSGAGSRPAVPAGLLATQDGYTLALARPVLPAGTAELTFTVTGPDGGAVTAYDVVHEKRLHLIVVRRDLAGYQHLHPELGADGRWRTPVRLSPGSWRVVADFAPTATGVGMVLGADLTVPGRLDPAAPPAAGRTAEVDGYVVRLAGRLGAGDTSSLRFSVTRGGAPVTDLQPHLGALGHLVALGESDLGYDHVHPTTGGGTRPGEIAFAVETATPGPRRLFLEFRHRGVVHTATFAVDAGATSDPEQEDSHDH